MTLAEQFDVLPCPVCKTNALVIEDMCAYGHAVHCAGCYDVDCDQDGFYPLSITAWGMALAEAVANWNEQVEDAAA